MKRQLPPLTGFRGIAAYTVLIAHAIDSSFVYSPPSLHAITSRLAYFGMSLFFVLSGFVIQHNYGAAFAKEPFGRALYRFFVARFARIYPLYIITLLPALAYIPSPYFAHEVGANVAYLTLTQSWFNLEMAVFAPDWSISTEWFFYFAFVPLTLVVVRWPLVTLAAVGIAGIAGLGTMFVLFSNNLIALVEQCCVHDAKVSASAWGWIVYFSPYVRLPEFIMGMLAAKAYATMSERRPSPRVANVVIGVCFAWCAAVIGLSAPSTVSFIGLLLPNFAFAPALALLLLFCCLHDGMVSRTLSGRPLMFAGEISYSVYIWSWSALTLLAPLFVSASPSALAYFNSGFKILACVGYATVFAYGSYLLIEAPARRYLRAKLIAVIPIDADTRAIGAISQPRDISAHMLAQGEKWRARNSRAAGDALSQLNEEDERDSNLRSHERIFY
jgi:peptidoglycan/LPS O-acetylase OafA/YrhL